MPESQTTEALGPVVVEPGVPLADGVYRALQAAISDGVLASGARLVETELTEKLGVSRTPVREALRRLQSEGVIEARPHRGFVVVDLMQEAETIYSIRQRLEGLAASIASQRITVPELNALDALQTEMDRLIEDLTPANAERIADLNREFHAGINGASQSSHLLRLIAAMSPTHLLRSVTSQYSEKTLRQSMSSHRRILQALWNRDGDLADRLVQEHVGHGKAVVVDMARNPDDVKVVRQGLSRLGERDGRLGEEDGRLGERDEGTSR